MHNKRGKILWIDDEIELLKPHILFLEEKGYKISISDNGQNGVEKSKQKVFDLVLLDQFMPGIDGIEVLKEIKENNPALPVIMITKSDEEWLMDEAISEKSSNCTVRSCYNECYFFCGVCCSESIVRCDN